MLAKKIVVIYRLGGGAPSWTPLTANLHNPS